MNSIIRLLPSLVEAASDNSELLETAAKVAWSTAAGEGLRNNTVPLRFYDHKLSVAVADAIWQTQLKAMSGELLTRTNRLLGRDLIKGLEFRVDPTSLRTIRSQAEYAGSPTVSIPIEIVTAADAIQDEILRERFLAAARSVIARREIKTGAELRSEIGN